MPSSLQFPLEAPISEIDLPLIDISRFPQDFDEQHLNHPQYHSIIAKLGEACREWGFFHLVNHGISVHLLEKVQTVSRDLLSMPTADKDRATNANELDRYYGSPHYESFRFSDVQNSDSVGKMARKLWPLEGNSNFCETVRSYASSLPNLAEKITKMILASLGLDVKDFYRSDFENCPFVLRINGYSSHEKSIGEEALPCHADLGCLTFLYQDDKGGLEIRSKEGRWFSVNPLPRSLVINVGDALKAWSNGRCRSAEHRVVYTGWKYRMSIAMFSVFPDEKEIWAPAELVDKENPRRYKPFIYSELVREVLTNKEDKEKSTALERFAGV